MLASLPPALGLGGPGGGRRSRLRPEAIELAAEPVRFASVPSCQLLELVICAHTCGEESVRELRSSLRVTSDTLGFDSKRDPGSFRLSLPRELLVGALDLAIQPRHFR
jgi:hypothetical protein